MKLNKTQQGMTLIELVIVIAIIAFLLALTAPKFMGVKGTTDGFQKYSIAAEGTKWANGVFTVLGSGAVTPANPIVHANNSLEDVVFTGTGLSATYQTGFTNLNLTPMRDMIVVATAPVAGTSAGAYQIGESVVSIVAPDSNRFMAWQFTNSTSEEVAALVAEFDPSTAFAANTADTTGTVRYTADGGTGLHTLTLSIQK